MSVWMFIGMLLVSAADLATTEIAISQGYASEGNPFMQSRALRVGSSIGFPIAAYLLTKDKPRVGKWVGMVYISAKSACTGWNIYVGVKVKWK